MDCDAAKRKPVRVVLAARRALAARLARPELAAVRRAVAFEARLEALSEEDIGAYVGHRLAAAGYGGEKALFSVEALAIVARASTGVPRLINVLCRTALEIAEATGQAAVSVPQVETAIQACLQRAQAFLVAEQPRPPPSAEVVDLAAATAHAAPPAPAGVWPVPVEDRGAGARPPAAPARSGKLARAAARALAALVVIAAAVSVFPSRTAPGETAPAGAPFAAEDAKARAIAAEPGALAPAPPAGSR